MMTFLIVLRHLFKAEYLFLNTHKMTYDYFNHVMPKIVESVNGQAGTVTIKGSDSMLVEKTKDGFLQVKVHPEIMGSVIGGIEKVNGCNPDVTGDCLVTDAHIPHEVEGDLEGTTVSEEIETLKDKTQKISCNNGTTTINSFTSITGNAAVRGFQCEYIHQAGESDYFAIQDNRNNGIILSKENNVNQIMLDSPNGTIKLSPGAKVLGNLEVWSGEIKLGASFNVECMYKRSWTPIRICKNEVGYGNG
jgi:hypothetical protein